VLPTIALQVLLHFNVNASVALPSKASSSVALISLSPETNATSIGLALASNASRLLYVNPSNVRVGQRIYVVADLRTANKQSVLLLHDTVVILTGKCWLQK
jgi:hypothetical protein